MTTLDQKIEMTGAHHNSSKTLMILFWHWKFVCDSDIAWKVVWCKAGITRLVS